MSNDSKEVATPIEQNQQQEHKLNSESVAVKKLPHTPAVKQKRKRLVMELLPNAELEQEAKNPANPKQREYQFELERRQKDKPSKNSNDKKIEEAVKVTAATQPVLNTIQEQSNCANVSERPLKHPNEKVEREKGDTLSIAGNGFSFTYIKFVLFPLFLLVGLGGLGYGILLYLKVASITTLAPTLLSTLPIAVFGLGMAFLVFFTWRYKTWITTGSAVPLTLSAIVLLIPPALYFMAPIFSAAMLHTFSLAIFSLILPYLFYFLIYHKKQRTRVSDFLLLSSILIITGLAVLFFVVQALSTESVILSVFTAGTLLVPIWMFLSLKIINEKVSPLMQDKLRSLREIQMELATCQNLLLRKSGFKKELLEKQTELEKEEKQLLNQLSELDFSPPKETQIISEIPAEWERNFSIETEIQQKLQAEITAAGLLVDKIGEIQKSLGRQELSHYQALSQFYHSDDEKNGAEEKQVPAMTRWIQSILPMMPTAELEKYFLDEAAFQQSLKMKVANLLNAANQLKQSAEIKLQAFQALDLSSSNIDHHAQEYSQALESLKQNREALDANIEKALFELHVQEVLKINEQLCSLSSQLENIQKEYQQLSEKLNLVEKILETIESALAESKEPSTLLALFEFNPHLKIDLAGVMEHPDLQTLSPEVKKFFKAPIGILTMQLLWDEISILKRKYNDRMIPDPNSPSQSDVLNATCKLLLKRKKCLIQEYEDIRPLFDGKQTLEDPHPTFRDSIVSHAYYGMWDAHTKLSHKADNLKKIKITAEEAYQNAQKYVFLKKIKELELFLRDIQIQMQPQVDPDHPFVSRELLCRGMNTSQNDVIPLDQLFQNVQQYLDTNAGNEAGETLSARLLKIKTLFGDPPGKISIQAFKQEIQHLFPEMSDDDPSFKEALERLTWMKFKLDISKEGFFLSQKCTVLKDFLGAVFQKFDSLSNAQKFSILRSVDFDTGALHLTQLLETVNSIQGLEPYCLEIKAAFKNTPHILSIPQLNQEKERICGILNLAPPGVTVPKDPISIELEKNFEALCSTLEEIEAKKTVLLSEQCAVLIELFRLIQKEGDKRCSVELCNLFSIIDSGLKINLSHLEEDIQIYIEANPDKEESFNSILEKLKNTFGNRLPQSIELDTFSCDEKLAVHPHFIALNDAKSTFKTTKDRLFLLYQATCITNFLNLISPYPDFVLQIDFESAISLPDLIHQFKLYIYDHPNSGIEKRNSFFKEVKFLEIERACRSLPILISIPALKETKNEIIKAISNQEKEKQTLETAFAQLEVSLSTMHHTQRISPYFGKVQTGFASVLFDALAEKAILLSDGILHINTYMKRAFEEAYVKKWRTLHSRAEIEIFVRESFLPLIGMSGKCTQHQIEEWVEVIITVQNRYQCALRKHEIQNQIINNIAVHFFGNEELLALEKKLFKQNMAQFSWAFFRLLHQKNKEATQEMMKWIPWKRRDLVPEVLAQPESLLKRAVSFISSFESSVDPEEFNSTSPAEEKLIDVSSQAINNIIASNEMFRLINRVEEDFIAGLAVFLSIEDHQHSFKEKIQALLDDTEQHFLQKCYEGQHTDFVNAIYEMFLEEKPVEKNRETDIKKVIERYLSIWKRGFDDLHPLKEEQQTKDKTQGPAHENVSMPLPVTPMMQNQASFRLNTQEEKANQDKEREEREAARVEAEKRKTEEKTLLVDKLYNLLFANTPFNNMKRAAASFFVSSHDFPLSKLFINQFNLERGSIAEGIAKQWIFGSINEVNAQKGNFSGNIDEDSGRVDLLYDFLCQKITQARQDPTSTRVTQDFAQKAKQLFATEAKGEMTAPSDQEACITQKQVSLLKEKVAKEATEAIGQTILEVIQARPKNELLPKGTVIVVEKTEYRKSPERNKVAELQVVLPQVKTHIVKSIFSILSGQPKDQMPETFSQMIIPVIEKGEAKTLFGFGEKIRAAFTWKAADTQNLIAIVLSDRLAEMINQGFQSSEDMLPLLQKKIKEAVLGFLNTQKYDFKDSDNIEAIAEKMIKALVMNDRFIKGLNEVLRAGVLGPGKSHLCQMAFPNLRKMYGIQAYSAPVDTSGESKSLSEQLEEEENRSVSEIMGDFLKDTFIVPFQSTPPGEAKLSVAERGSKVHLGTEVLRKMLNACIEDKPLEVMPPKTTSSIFSFAFFSHSTSTQTIPIPAYSLKDTISKKLNTSVKYQFQSKILTGVENTPKMVEQDNAIARVLEEALQDNEALIADSIAVANFRFAKSSNSQANASTFGR